MRRLVAGFVSAVLLAGSLVSAATAGTSPEKTIVWVASRVGAGPTQFAVEMTAGYDDSHALLAAAFVRATRHGLRALPDAAVYSDEGHDGAYAYTHGHGSHCVGVTSRCSITRAQHGDNRHSADGEGPRDR